MLTVLVMHTKKQMERRFMLEWGPWSCDSIGLLVWGFWIEPSSDDESAWEAPKAKWKESSCWKMYQDCDPTGTMKRNLIMKLSRDANRPWEAPKAKWKEGSWWTMYHDCEPTGTMKRHLILKLSRDANRPLMYLKANGTKVDVEMRTMFLWFDWSIGVRILNKTQLWWWERLRST